LDHPSWELSRRDGQDADAEEVEIKGVVAGTGEMAGEGLVGRGARREAEQAGWDSEEEGAAPGQGAEASRAGRQTLQRGLACLIRSPWIILCLGALLLPLPSILLLEPNRMKQEALKPENKSSSMESPSILLGFFLFRELNCTLILHLPHLLLPCQEEVAVLRELEWNLIFMTWEEELPGKS
jgi:hypothetical protein